MGKIYWTGPRESDYRDTGDLIQGSATFYGDNKTGNTAYCSKAAVRINHNLYSSDASDFILKWQLQKIEQEPDCHFMAYNPNCVFGAPQSVVERTLCLNDEALMHRIDNKIEFRKMVEGLIPLMPEMILQGKDCHYTSLREKSQFSGFDSFVIQEPVSSGGQGTYLLTRENASLVHKMITPDAEYIVTAYQKQNVPINLHAVIFDEKIQLFPGSVQIICAENHRLLYRGADYIAYTEIEPYLQDEFLNGGQKICRCLQREGYRGVVGIDAMIVGNSIYYLEVNNRFQGSSFLLNKALNKQGLPSLPMMNLYAFQGKALDKQVADKIRKLDVPYSFYTYLAEPNNQHVKTLFHRLHQEKKMECVEEVITEGYDEDQPAETYATLFSVVFNSNICSLCNRNMSVRIYQNIRGTSPIWDQKIYSRDWTAIKTALINQGAIISEEAKQYIRNHGKMRSGTYFSLDLFVNGIYMNCPLYVKYTQLSPFEIVFDSKRKKLGLTYYGKFITHVAYDIKKAFPVEKLSSGIPIEEICFLATDRLRLQNSPFCTFAKHHVACRFCEANGICNHFSEDDILEAIDVVCHSKDTMFRHILIGGLSNDVGQEIGTLQKMCACIRRYTDKPIYLMCLPPQAEHVREYYRAGVTEFGFNLEVFDRALARKYMPGKGALPIERYFEAFEAATECVGKSGNVRCAFIAGLEPMDSLLEGIETVCKMGVQPILSVFRPIPGTEMENLVPPDNEWLMELLEKSEEICRRYGLSLGPDCPACRNNTLSYVKPNEVLQVYSDRWRRDEGE